MNVPLFLEIKNEYTDHLTDVLYPHIYEGINSIYKAAVKVAEDSGKPDSILAIFQKLLQDVANWNQVKIEEETNRIKQASGTSEYLDDLIKAVFKSNIILLCYSNTISNNIAQTFYNNFSTSSFIHRCYVVCAKDAHNNPFLYYHDVSPMDVKRNKIIIDQNMQSAISRAIRTMLPISLILKEYLVNSINIIEEPPKYLPLSDKKVEPKLEQQIKNIIEKDSKLSEQERIKAVIGIEHAFNNVNNKPPGISDNPANANLGQTAKIFKSEAKQPLPPVATATSLSNGIYKVNPNPPPQPQQVAPTNKFVGGGELSERVDPTKINYIENYGGDYNKSRRK